MFGCPPIGDGDDETSRFVRENATEAVVGVERAAHPPPAMKEHEHGKWPIAVGGVDPNRNRVTRPLNREVSHVFDGFRSVHGEQLL
jgi:hypothetical protein